MSRLPSPESLSAYSMNIVGAPKYRRLLLRVAITVIFIFILVIITGLTIFDKQHNHILQDYVAREDDLVILSATLYKNSTFYKPNTVVLLINAHQLFHFKHAQLDLISANATLTRKTSFRIQQVVGQVPFYCKWVPFLAIGNVVDESEYALLENDNGQQMKVPFRLPYEEKHSVVVCFTPMFLNDRWQLLLLTAEVYTHYGAFMHFYVRSMISDLFQLLSLYRNSRISEWPTIQLGRKRAASMNFNPNRELEFRNQAAAMTDCLLRYKQAADYIFFPDPDDVIIPRLGENYAQEFQKLFQFYPTAAVLAYNMTQTELISEISPKLYSISKILRSIKFKGEVRWGKLVVRPAHVNSVWIHQSYAVEKGFTQHSLPVETNSLLHLRFWSFKDRVNLKKSLPKYDPYRKGEGKNNVIEEIDLEQIDDNFTRRINKRLLVFEKLPVTPIYYPIIEKCYNTIFYNGLQHNSCKGPEYCQLPSLEGTHCINVVSSFQTMKVEGNIYIHQLSSTQFEQSLNGCRL